MKRDFTPEARWQLLISFPAAGQAAVILPTQIMNV
jgi:hypothetical protein